MTDFKFKPGDIIIHKANREKAVVAYITNDEKEGVKICDCGEEVIDNYCQNCDYYF